MPARLFQNLRPRSEAAVRHALVVLNDPVGVGLLAAQIRNGKVEFFFTDGPAEIHIDPWRLHPPLSA